MEFIFTLASAVGLFILLPLAFIRPSLFKLRRGAAVVRASVFFLVSFIGFGITHEPQPKPTVTPTVVAVAEAPPAPSVAAPAQPPRTANPAVQLPASAAPAPAQADAAPIPLGFPMREFQRRFNDAAATQKLPQRAIQQDCSPGPNVATCRYAVGESQGIVVAAMPNGTAARDIMVVVSGPSAVEFLGTYLTLLTMLEPRSDVDERRAHFFAFFGDASQEKREARIGNTKFTFTRLPNVGFLVSAVRVA